jgi:hypothetical protein
MADYRALVVTTGGLAQIPTADSLLVGAGIKTASGDLTVTPAGTNVTLATNKTINMVAGTGAADFSNGSGLFKTTTGAATIGPGAVTVSGVTTFTGAGTALTVNNDALVTGDILTDGDINRNTSGTLAIGNGANTTTLFLGRATQLTHVQGNFQVDGTETIVGISTFQADATFQGNVTFGNATTDTVTFTSRIATGTDIIPLTNASSDLGTSALRFDVGYFVSLDVTNGLATPTLFNGTAGEAITAGSPVAMQNAAGVPKVYLGVADAGGAPHIGRILGIALAAAAGDGSAVSVVIAGQVDVPDALWDALPAVADVGQYAYLSETDFGFLTMTAPTTIGATRIKVGIISRGGTGAVRVVVQVTEALIL